MRNLEATMAALSDDANGICEDQTTSGSGALTLDGALVSGGVATAANAQIVAIEGSGDNSGIDFTVTGTDADGVTISETIDGENNGTAKTTLYFKTVTGISADGAVTGNVEAGFLATDGAVTKSLRVNSRQSDFGLGVFVNLSASASLTYTAQYAYEQPEDSYTNSYSSDADWRGIDGLESQTADAESNIAYPVNAVRLLIGSAGFTSGSAVLTVTQ